MGEAGCETHYGWMMVLSGVDGGCGYTEQRTYPSIIYSGDSTETEWEAEGKHQSQYVDALQTLWNWPHVSSGSRIEPLLPMGAKNNK